MENYTETMAASNRHSHDSKDRKTLRPKIRYLNHMVYRIKAKTQQEAREKN